MDTLPGSSPGVQYRDFVLAHEAGRTSQTGIDGVGYWVRTLADAPAFPAVRPPLHTEPPGEVPVEIGPGVLERLRAIRTEHGASWFMVAATALAALLHRWTGADDVTFGCPMASRERFPDVIGPCLNTVVLRSRCAEGGSVLHLLHAMRDTVLDAFDHQDVPFEDIVDRLNPPRRPGWTPYIDFLLATTTGRGEPPTIAGVELSPIRLDHDGAGYAAKFGLSVGLEEVGGGLRGTIMYRGDRFTGAEVRRMAGWLGRFIDNFVDVLDEPVHTLELVDDDERAELSRFEAGPPAAAPTTVPELLAGQCAANPDAPAVRSGRGVLSRGALDRRAAELAAVLRPHARGAQPVVALSLPRGEELVVAMLAAWKAGFLFCPLDPAYPESRTRFILTDLDACAVVTDDPAAFTRVNPSGAAVIDVAAMPAAGAPAPSGTPAPGSTAYVLYTSGTTGEPKGVEYSHRGVAQVARWHADEFDMRPEDRSSWLHSVAFDVSQYEIWPALCAGAQLVPHEGPVVPVGLGTWLTDREVTVCNVPTPLAEALWAADTELPTLRWMIFAGSPLTTMPPAVGYRIRDEYGPTETFVTTNHVLVPDEATVLNCIGRPNAGVRIHVLDEAGHRSPIGMPGEIHVGGVTVAKGYWKRADLTRQRFATAGPGGIPGPVYRTGDQGRWLPDGTLEYLGRLDRQLKVRGYRVEPQEIEFHLRRDPLVGRAVVHAFPDDAAPLVAYLVATDGGAGDSAAVLARLTSQVPDFMVPNAIVWLPELPMNSRGKVDVGRLPRPDRDQLAGDTGWVEPETGMEQRIAAVWSGVLGIESVGSRDNFFDLGGNSLLLSTLHSRLQAELAVTLPIQRLFEYPTVHSLAHALTSAQPRSDGGDLARDRAAKARLSRARRGRPVRPARSGDE